MCTSGVWQEKAFDNFLTAQDSSDPGTDTCPSSSPSSYPSPRHMHPVSKIIGMREQSRMIEVDSRAFRVRMPGFDLVLLLIGCVTLDKSLNLSELQFPHL